MMKITIEQILSYGPCGSYNTAEKIIRRTGIGWPATPRCIWNCGINREHKLWALCQAEVLTVSDVAAMAEIVLPVFESLYPADKRPRRAIDAARSGSFTDAADITNASAACDVAVSDDAIPAYYAAKAAYYTARAAAAAATAAAVDNCYSDAYVNSGMAEQLYAVVIAAIERSETR